MTADPPFAASGAPAPDARFAFVLELGRMLSLAGTAVSETQERLNRIAHAYGLHGARIIALPTALMVSFGPATPATIEAVQQIDGALRLDQISELYRVVELAQIAAIDPEEGLARLARVRTMQPRAGVIATIISYALMATALCLILNASPKDVAVAGALGGVVGIFVLIGRHRPTLTVLMPVLAAITVSALALQATKHGLVEPGLRTLIAPLVIFLPGAALTTATLELASGEMVAGASRLVFGLLQLALLAFGIVAGTELSGTPSDEVLRDHHHNVIGWWAPWLGVVIFALAIAYYFSAPRGSVRYLVLVLLVAWAGQRVGHFLFGAQVSGFVGALAMTPVALTVAKFPNGPPSQVTFLPAFWVLVPGALGLISLTEIFVDPSSGAGNFIDPISSIIAIALGVLCGASIFRSLEHVPGRMREHNPLGRT